ncbi:MAG: methylamine utilization protein [Proteobacteria bacterium]|nr:methylamine utilization protein [Pseudomonadota bacterium]
MIYSLLFLCCSQNNSVSFGPKKNKPNPQEPSSETTQDTAVNSDTDSSYADELTGPDLGPTPILNEDYNYADLNLPQHYTDLNSPYGVIASSDNTPQDNPITDEGATLGRVLFYDKRLSRNDTTACSSCHIQSTGFSDPLRLSIGLYGDETHRHSMPLVNLRYYSSGEMFWDERASSIEDQALEAIQNPIEMDMPLELLELKLERAEFYPPLFEAAFGDSHITEERISKAIAQFVRSMVSFNSKYDQAFANGENGVPNFEDTFTELELLGNDLFGSVLNPSNADVVAEGSDEDTGAEEGVTSLRCDTCHRTAAHFSGLASGALEDNLEGPFATNNGLDIDTSADEGAGNGRFKSPSLRNIAVRGLFMHDGRFQSLEQVVEFYNSGVQDHPSLHRLLRQFIPADHGDGFPPPVFFNLTTEEKDALVAFMETLTDETFLNDPRYSDPFAILE